MAVELNMKTNKARLHLTNVAGVGATQLLQSLLPALEKSPIAAISEIYLPNRGHLSSFTPLNQSTRSTRYSRLLPNVLSRLLECSILGRQFSAATPLLVLGDIPIANVENQTVFVQTPHLLQPTKVHFSLSYLKYAISRAIFRMNLKYVKAFIVQTKIMRDGLIASYPALADKIFVIPQPVPAWLLESRLIRRGRVRAQGDKLSLIYPAATYPHKNHRILSGIASSEVGDWPIDRLVLTIEAHLNPVPTASWIECTGLLSPNEMIQAYKEVDGLLFLSREESFGFPLVEAMFVGLPIICPDLPYARTLCGDQAVYFDPNNLSSLKTAISILQNKISQGWWPDWSKQMSFIPTDWESVANDMLAITMRDMRADFSKLV
jgi:hypothetical protein